MNNSSHAILTDIIEEIGARTVALHQYRKRVEASRRRKSAPDADLQFQEQLLDRHTQLLADLIDQFTADQQHQPRPTTNPRARPSP